MSDPDRPAVDVGWLDVSAGASGDMLLGALVGAGVPLATLQEAVDALGLPERVTLHAEQTVRAGLAATRIHVETPEPAGPRHPADIAALLAGSALLPAVRDRAGAVFDRLARAEAGVHGCAVADVHFHEVGALDALADVVGVCAGLAALGLRRLVASPLAVGSGHVRGEHGLLPVPVPAVLALLAAAGAPTLAGPVAHEACTPTGAALLAAWVTDWGPLPPLVPTAVGVGAGSRDTAGAANVVRLVVGRATAPEPDGDGPEPEPAVLLEANVDDLDPRVWPTVLDALLGEGAADAWLTPVLMKKGRPAHVLSVLAAPGAVPALRRAVFTYTSTIGLRETDVRKRPLPRTERTVDVDGCAVRVKLSSLDGQVLTAQPEFEDVVAAATALGRPVRAVLALAAERARAGGADRPKGSPAR